ncbi:hypothetical protein O6H91_13G049100 [Diphasiastrum complanatum]|uniref:Uncharacterized protein n=1 Tax=Diphasiastrum complanatum TaxID=34168 RepID=A0ACC2BUK2_DIPCM|nr:hypothetical protein O6H91_13G049100 [Diphasiastrum complanatum]
MEKGASHSRAGENATGDHRQADRRLEEGASHRQGRRFRRCVDRTLSSHPGSEEGTGRRVATGKDRPKQIEVADQVAVSSSEDQRRGRKTKRSQDRREWGSQGSGS